MNHDRLPAVPEIDLQGFRGLRVEGWREAGGARSPISIHVQSTDDEPGHGRTWVDGGTPLGLDAGGAATLVLHGLRRFVRVVPSGDSGPIAPDVRTRLTRLD